MKLDLRRKRDLGRILDDSFAIYRAHWRTLLLIAFAVVVPVNVLVIGVGLGYLWSDYDPVEAGDELQASDVSELIVPILAQMLVITPLVTAMTVHVVRTAAEGRSVTAREAMAVGVNVFPKLLVAIALVGIGIFFGFLALIVPGLILAVRWIVVSQAVVVEDLGGTEALRRSFELTRGHFWPSFLVMIVLLLLVGVLSAVLGLPLDYASEQAGTMAFTLLGTTLSNVLFLPLVAVAYTLLYYSLLVEKGEAPAIDRPAADPGSPSSTDGSGEPQALPGVPGTFGDGWAPPRPPGG